MLSSGSYGKLVPEKVKFYAYDANKHSFPRGIGELRAPPTDTDGSKMYSEEQRLSNLPALYVFPATNKAMPWTPYTGRAFAIEQLEYIVGKASFSLNLDLEDFRDLGKRTVDEDNFIKVIEKEGVINLRRASFDEL